MQKGGRNMKKAALVATLSALSAFAVGAVGCKEDETEATLDYALPTQTEISVGESFTPDFKLGGDTTAELVSLKVPVYSETKANGMAFTPDATGRYEYTVLFKNGEESVRETVVFTAADHVAPVFGEMLAKETELGFYHELQADLDEIAKNVTDNCAKTVTVYPKSISFNGKETALDKDVAQLFFTEVGEYTVNVIAEDYSGNQAEKSYKITASDSVNPVIEAPQAFISWVVDGKVKLPSVNVIDVAKNTLTITAKDGNDNDVRVENGYLNVAKTGVYTLNYTATDTSGNVGTASVKLYVKEKGVIADFNDEDDASVFGGADSWYQDNALSVLTTANETTVSYDEYFSVGDWSDFARLTVDVQNKRPADLTVQAELLIGGEWKTAASALVKAATVDAADFVGVVPTDMQYVVYLEQYDTENVQGLRFRMSCDGGVSATLDNVKLFVNDDRTLPDEGTFTGFGAGTYWLSAGGVVSLTGEQLSAANAVKLNLYSTADANVRIVLKYGNETVSARRALVAGDNAIVRLIDVEKGAGVITTGLTGIDIYNEEDFGFTVCSDGVTAENLTAIPLETYAKLDKTYGVTYGETFTVPYPFLVSSKYYGGLRICVLDEYDENHGEVSVGQQLFSDGKSGFAAGAYKIEYAFEDAFGVEQTLVYTFNVEKKVLAIDLEMPALFIDQVDENGIALPDPTLSSDVYSATELAAASVEKYYRESGRVTWNKISATTKFLPVSSGLYELRYVVTLDGLRKEFKFEKFVHESNSIVDFEQESDVGYDCVQEDKKANHYEVLKSRFLFDGGYYDYHTDHVENNFDIYSGWSKSGKYSLSVKPTTNGWFGFLIKNMTGKQMVNAVTFTMKTDVAFSNQQIWLGGAGGVYSDKFESVAGEKTYTVLLKKEIALEDIQSFTINARGYARTSIDDVKFGYVKRLETSGLDYQDVLDTSAPYTAVKPTLSSEYYSEEQLAAAKYELTYGVNGNDGKPVLPDAQNQFVVTLPKAGTATFKWTVTMPDGYSVSKTVTINVGVQIDADVQEAGNVGEEITLSTELISEYAISNVKVEYRFGADGEWVALESPYAFTPAADKAGRYFVRYTATVNVDGQEVETELIKDIFVRDGNEKALLDFEPMVGGTTIRGGSVYGGNFATVEVRKDENYNGYLSISSPNNNSWSGIEGLALEFAATSKLKVTVSSEIAFTYSSNGLFCIETEKGKWLYSDVRSIQAGTHEYVLDFGESFTKLRTFSVKTKIGLYQQIKIDDVIPVDLKLSGEFPTELELNVEATIPTCTYDGELNTGVQYRLQGAKDWTAITNGKISFARAGKYEVQYTFASGKVAVYTITVNAPETAELDAAMPTEITLDVETTLPTATYENSTAIIEYRVKGTKDWTAVANGKFTPTECEVYEVRYTFGEMFTKTYAINVLKPQVNITMAAQAYVGDTFTPPTVTYKEKAATVRYRMQGDEEWLDLPESGTLVLTTVGTYEWQFSFDKFAIEKELVAVLPPYELSADWVGLVKQGEELTLPTATYNGETATAYYRRSGVNAWTEVQNGKIKFAWIATYEVRYAFTGFDVIKLVQVDDPNIIMDFDGDDSMYGGSVYGGNNATVEIVTDESGNSCLAISKATQNNWAGLQNMSLAFAETSKLKLIVTVDKSFDYTGSGIFSIQTENGWLYSDIKGLQAGTHEYVLDFGQSFTTMKAFTVKSWSSLYGKMQIDNITIVTE